MINLIRGEFFRLIHSKKVFYYPILATVVLVFVVIISDMNVIGDYTGSFSVFEGNALRGMGLIFFITLATILGFMKENQKNGYDKNIVSVISKREKLALADLIIGFGIFLFYNVFNYFVVMFFKVNALKEKISWKWNDDTVRMLLTTLNWFLLYAFYIIIVAVIAVGIRSVIVCDIIIFLTSTKLLYQGVTTGLNLFVSRLLKLQNGDKVLCRIYSCFPSATEFEQIATARNISEKTYLCEHALVLTAYVAAALAALLFVAKRKEVK